MMQSKITKILVVDDNSMNLKMMTAVIREHGRSILTASSGYDALDILQANPDIALVLMDIQMPEIGGFETVELIKKDPKLEKIPIIFISGIYNKDEFIEHGYALGAYEFMLKPFETYLLKNKVNIFVKLYQQQCLIEKKLSETSLLSDLNKMMILSEDEEEIIASVCDSLFRTDKYEAVFAINVESEDGTPKYLHELLAITDESIGDSIDELASTDLLYDTLVACPVVRAFKTDKVQIEADLDTCQGCTHRRIHSEKSALVAIPLLSDHTQTVIVLFTKSDISISDEDLQFFKLLSDSVVFGLNAAHLKADHIRAQNALQIEKEELRISVDSLGEGIIRVDSEGRINLMNKAARSILDIPMDSIVDGGYIFNVCKVIGRDNSLRLFNPIDWLHSSGVNENASKQIRISTNADNSKILSLIVSEIKDQKGMYHGVILVVRDVTDDLRLEQQKALSQKLESIGSLAAGIAHEINTPMQFIGDNETFLKDSFQSLMTFLADLKSMYKYALPTELQDNVKESIEALEVQHDMEYIANQIPIAIDRSMFGIARVNKIITSLRNFSHSSNREKVPSNINKAIEDTIIISTNEWKYLAEMKTNLDPKIPLINCSIDEINQVFVNIIINATHTIKDKIDSGEFRIGRIEIETRLSPPEVEIIISDNGMGIPAEYANKVFDPFFTTKEVGRGTGQGLSIAHDIISKHDGRITFDTKPGEGTSFHIFLPLT